MDEATKLLRASFEDWISGPPYERSVARWSNSPSHAWPGQYKDIAVQLAWEATERAVEALPAAAPRRWFKCGQHTFMGMRPCPMCANAAAAQPAPLPDLPTFGSGTKSAPLPAGAVYLSDYIAEQEKIPERKALLDQARAELAAPLPGPPREPTHLSRNETISHPDGDDLSQIKTNARIPREPTPEMIDAMGEAFLARNDCRRLIFDDDVRVIWRAGYDAAMQTTDQGDCVIAPNPTGVQGQSTMQAGGVTGNTTKR